MAVPSTTNTTTLTTFTTPQPSLQTSTTSSSFANAAIPAMPQPNRMDMSMNGIPLTQNFADVGYMQPNYAPNFDQEAPIMPNGMNINGEYVDQATIQQI